MSLDSELNPTKKELRNFAIVTLLFLIGFLIVFLVGWYEIIRRLIV